MNAVSYILLALVAGIFIVVARYVIKGSGKKSCCKDSCSGCCDSSRCNS